MLRSLTVRKLAALQKDDPPFVRGLNLVLSVNGVGSARLLKRRYALTAVSADSRRPRTERQAQSVTRARIAEKSINALCLAGRLDRSAHHRTGCSGCESPVVFAEPDPGLVSRILKELATNGLSRPQMEEEAPGALLFDSTKTMEHL